MIIHKCDKCGKLVEQTKGSADSLPNGWARFDYKWTKPERSSLLKGFDTQSYEVCSDCEKRLRSNDAVGVIEALERGDGVPIRLDGI